MTTKARRGSQPEWRLCAGMALVISAAFLTHAQTAPDPFSTGDFRWTCSPPLIDVGPGKEAADPVVSIKDPTVVFSDGRWHVFATVRMQSGKVDIEYLNFADWNQANLAPRHILGMHDQYYCARWR